MLILKQKKLMIGRLVCNEAVHFKIKKGILLEGGLSYKHVSLKKGQLVGTNMADLYIYMMTMTMNLLR